VAVNSSSLLTAMIGLFLRGTLNFGSFFELGGLGQGPLLFGGGGGGAPAAADIFNKVIMNVLGEFVDIDFDMWSKKKKRTSRNVIYKQLSTHFVCFICFDRHVYS